MSMQKRWMQNKIAKSFSRVWVGELRSSHLGVTCMSIGTEISHVSAKQSTYRAMYSFSAASSFMPILDSWCRRTIRRKQKSAGKRSPVKIDKLPSAAALHVTSDCVPCPQITFLGIFPHAFLIRKKRAKRFCQRCLYARRRGE